MNFMSSFCLLPLNNCCCRQCLCGDWEDGKISEMTALGSLSEEKDEDEADEYQSELQITNTGAQLTMALYAYFLNLGLA